MTKNIEPPHVNPVEEAARRVSERGAEYKAARELAYAIKADLDQKIADLNDLKRRLEDAVKELHQAVGEYAGGTEFFTVASVVEPEPVVNTPAPAPEPKWIEILSLEGLAELESATVAIPTGAVFFAHEGNYYIFANANKEKVGI